jgi:hypothetical protein
VDNERRKHSLPSLSFRARVFAALVGISATTSLVIGLVLYYFAEDRLLAEERETLARRSQTANAGAGVFLEGLRDPEDGTFPSPETFAEELVRSVSDPTGGSASTRRFWRRPKNLRRARAGSCRSTVARSSALRVTWRSGRSPGRMGPREECSRTNLPGRS